MRTFLLAALAALTVTLVGPRTAQATHWECIGADWVCSDARAPKKAAKPAAAQKANKAAPAYSYAYEPVYPQAKKAKKPSSYASGGSLAYGGPVYSGMASYYWQPQKLASGGWFNPNAMTAAHKTLPFGTKVRVTHMGNGKSVTVTINDRGPYIKGRIIDLSSAAAGVIGMKGQGVARVQVAVLGK
jgi:rare lipoprotein A